MTPDESQVQQPFQSEPQTDPRIYFAAERTYLAWIRTGLSLMGIGFAVARFGLFLREMNAVGKAAIPTHGVTQWSGTALVLMGVLILVAATLQHLRMTAALRNGTYIPGKPSMTGVVLAWVLAILGLGMAYYLVVMR